MSKASEKKLGELHGVIAEHLIERIQAQEVKTDGKGNPIRDEETGAMVKEACAPAVLSVAVRFLKDNEIVSDPGDENSPIHDLAKAVDQFSQSRHGHTDSTH